MFIRGGLALQVCEGGAGVSERRWGSKGRPSNLLLLLVINALGLLRAHGLRILYIVRPKYRGFWAPFATPFFPRSLWYSLLIRPHNECAIVLIGSYVSFGPTFCWVAFCRHLGLREGAIDLRHKKIRGRRAPVLRRQKSRQRRSGRKNERSSTPIRVSFRGLRRYLPARRMP